MITATLCECVCACDFTYCKLKSSVLLWFSVSLIGVDMGHTTSRVAIRFANVLRNLIPSNDVGVMEMTASAMGKLALASSTITAEYVEYEAKRAFEWLSGDRHEGRRHAAVSGHHHVSRWHSGRVLDLIIIIIIIPMTMFILYSAVIMTTGHCESSLGSSDECRTAPSSRRPSDQAT